jgi:hypothetical protein
MSLEQEKKAVMQLLMGQDPLTPYGNDRKRLVEVAAAAVVMLESLPPHLYDCAWACVADGRVRRLRRGMAGVREAKWLDSEPHALVPVADLQEAADALKVQWMHGEAESSLGTRLRVMANEAPNALPEGSAEEPADA